MYLQPLDNPPRIVYNNTVRVDKELVSTFREKAKRNCDSLRSVHQTPQRPPRGAILYASGGETS